MSLRRTTGIALAAIFLADPAAIARTSDDKPVFGFSVARRKPDATIDGPLLQKAKAAIAAAKANDSARFAALFATRDAMAGSIMNRSTVRFDIPTIQAATRSCVGPWAYDEGTSWVQFSWICDPDPSAPLAKIIRFQTTPELSITMRFKDGKISAVEAMEPFPIPGAAVPAMDAFCAAVRDGTPFAYSHRCKPKR